MKARLPRKNRTAVVVVVMVLGTVVLLSAYSIASTLATAWGEAQRPVRKTERQDPGANGIAPSASEAPQGVSAIRRDRRAGAVFLAGVGEQVETVFHSLGLPLKIHYRI